MRRLENIRLELDADESRIRALKADLDRANGALDWLRGKGDIESGLDLKISLMATGARDGLPTERWVTVKGVPDSLKSTVEDLISEHAERLRAEIVAIEKKWEEM